MNRKATFILALFLLTAISTPASACKLAEEAYDLGAFIEADRPSQVIFQGKVSSIDEIAPPPGVILEQRIRVDVRHWWRGGDKETIVVAGSIEKPTGSSCDGNWNFKASVGQELLIVGYEKKGLVYPYSLLSKVLTHEKTPIEVQKILRTIR